MVRLIRNILSGFLCLAFLLSSGVDVADCQDKVKKPAKITWDERNIYVNGQLFYVKGVSYSLDYGPKQDFKSVPFSVWEKDFEMMRQAGINTIRTYAPLPTSVLDLADKYGLKVIENICYPGGGTKFNSKSDLEGLKRTALAYVERDKDHPAILMWSIWNDMPFRWSKEGSILKKYDKRTVNAFLKEIYDAIKESDPDHPVTGSNILGEEGEDIGFGFLDVLGFNAFVGITDWFNGGFSLREAKKQVSKIERICSIQQKKPGLILETGYSTYCKKYSQGKVVEAQIKAAGTKVAGVVVFQWSDGWHKAGNPLTQDNHIEEHWGIVDAFRDQKSGYKAVSQAFGMIQTKSRGYRGVVKF
ncbi:MAG: hypothetical protein ISS26_02275 [Candidatus Omnitrophica bacterium]|nr:hypothetical protein [Candidatus Omnitrophota bacterium]